MVRDSIRIYSLILKYLFSSVAAAVIDESAFFLLQTLFGGIAAILMIPTTLISAFLARVISSLINFLINAKVVFGDKPGKKALIRYYILAVALIAVSGLLVLLLESVLSITSPAVSTLVKTVIDTCLFFFSFRIQHKWVFNSENS